MAKKTIAAVPGQPTVVSDSGTAGKKNRNYVAGTRQDPRKPISNQISMKKLSGIREEAFIKFLRTKGRLDLKAFMNPSEFGSLYREFLKTITWTLIIQELEIDAEYAGRFRNFCESEDGIEEVDLGNFNKKELNDLIKRFNAEYFQHPHEDEY